MLGGALLFGAWGRMRRQPTVWNVGIWTLGSVILLNSRPFEGAVASLVTALAMLVSFWRNPPPLQPAQVLARVAPSALLAICAASGMAYYNYRVTGNPLRLPYQVHEETYMVSPIFLWQALRQISYRHPVMEQFYTNWALDWYTRQQDLRGLLSTKGPIAVALMFVFLRLALTANCLALPWVLRRAEMRTVALLLLVSVGPSMLVPWWQSHYLAPVLPLVFLLAVQACRCACLFRPLGRPLGPAWAWGLLLLWGVSFAGEAAAYLQTRRADWSSQRAQIVQQLKAEPGRHLVLVRYRPEHSGLDEWVYNEADLDRSQIVWARELKPEENRRLKQYFRDRRVWLLEADANPPVLQEQER